MLVLINGLPLFAQQIANDMTAFQKQHRFVFCNTYYSKWGKLKFFLLLPFASICISVNGVSDASGTLNWVLRLRKKLIMMWSGTDVLLAQKRANKHTFNRKYIDYAINTTDSNLLSSELNALSINHRFLYFKWLPAGALVQQHYASIKVLSYVAQNKEDFYGWQTIRTTAIANPAIEFILVGTDGSTIDCPSNVRCLGWIDKAEMNRLYQSCAIFLRLTAHDGFSLSVLEAVANGAELIWTTPLPGFVLHWDGMQNFESLFQRALENIKQRNNTSDLNRQSALVNTYNREHVLGNFIRFINELQ